MIDVDPYWNEVFLNGANKLRVAQAVSLYGVARGAVVGVEMDIDKSTGLRS